MRGRQAPERRRDYWATLTEGLDVFVHDVMAAMTTEP